MEAWGEGGGVRQSADPLANSLQQSERSWEFDLRFCIFYFIILEEMH